MKNKNPKSLVIPPELRHAYVWYVSDITRVLRISERQAYKLVAEERIPFSKVGKRKVFIPAQILDWLAKGGTR